MAGHSADQPANGPPRLQPALPNNLPGKIVISSIYVSGFESLFQLQIPESEISAAIHGPAMGSRYFNSFVRIFSSPWAGSAPKFQQESEFLYEYC